MPKATSISPALAERHLQTLQRKQLAFLRDRQPDITNNVKRTFSLNSSDLRGSSVYSLHRHDEIHVSLLYEAFLALIDIGFNKRIQGIADGDGFRSSSTMVSFPSHLGIA